MSGLDRFFFTYFNAEVAAKYWPLILDGFILTTWIAAKIYRVGILMYGKKPTWKELYRWLQY